MIRVAQVMGKMNFGGVEASVMNYYRNIDRTKVKFDFIVDSDSECPQKEEIELLGGKVIFVPPYQQMKSYITTLIDIFKKEKYDIVHAQLTTMSVFPLYAAKKAGIKVRIAHSHNTANRVEWKKNILKNALRPFSKKYATHYFACSELAGRYLFGNKAFNKGNITVINNSIDFNKFKFNEEKRNIIRTKYGLNKNFVVGHIGRFVKQKNHMKLIEIFYSLLKERKDAKLILIGDGPLQKNVEEKVKKLNIQDNVLFIGTVSNPYDYYNAMDVFLLPSLYEGLPVVGVEAQINGLKCLFSDNITKEAKISDNTFFLPIKNIKEWIEKLDECDNNRNITKIELDSYNIEIQANILEKKYFDISKAL